MEERKKRVDHPSSSCLAVTAAVGWHGESDIRCMSGFCCIASVCIK